jgi:hypothetical protein
MLIKKKRKKNGNKMSRLAEPLLDGSQDGTELHELSESSRDFSASGSDLYENSHGSSKSIGARGFKALSSMWTNKHHRESNHQEDIRNPWKIEFSDVTLKNHIGHGQFGTVYSGLYQEQDVAVKQMQLSSETEAFKKELSQAQVEIKILWSLR